jgi:hypothetical protein
VIEAKGTNARVTFDGVLVTIHRGGARGWLRGTGIRSIPAWAIAAVELKPAGLGRGWIRFEVDTGEGDEGADAEIDDEPVDLDDDEEEDGNGTGAGWGTLGRRKADQFDPGKDQNTVLFTRGHQREFEDVRRAVKTAMWEASQSRAGEGDGDDDFPPTRRVATGAGATAAGPDPVHELRKLGQLLHEGVLSRAEFDRAKARLLDRI